MDENIGRCPWLGVAKTTHVQVWVVKIYQVKTVQVSTGHWPITLYGSAYGFNHCCLLEAQFPEHLVGWFCCCCFSGNYCLPKRVVCLVMVKRNVLYIIGHPRTQPSNKNGSGSVQFQKKILWPWVRWRFLRYDIKSMSHKEENNKVKFIKVKNFSSKDTMLREWKRSHRLGKNMQNIW